MAKDAESVKRAEDTGQAVRIAPFASLKYRDYRLLWAGLPFSQTGFMMRTVATSWQVYQISDSSALLGLTFLFQGLPSLLLGPFGGTLADIMDRRRLMMITQSTQIALATVLGLLTLSGMIQVWHIYGITFLAAAVSSAEGPARLALIPTIVPRSHILNATTLQATATQASFLLGPSIGGISISAIGVGATYFVNAGFVLPAMAAILMLRSNVDAERKKVTFNLEGVFEGLAFAFRTRVLLGLLMLDTVTMVFGYYPAMMPVFAEDILKVGPRGLGALLSAPAFGAMLGFGVLLMLGNVKSKGALILAVTVIHGIVLLLFAISTWFLLALLLVAVLGILDSMSMSVRQTSFQLLASEEARGRIVSVSQIFAVASNSLGGANLGLITALTGVRMSLGIGGVIGASFALLVALLSRQVRQFKA